MPATPASFDSPGDPNRRFEDIQFLLTGIRQTGDDGPEPEDTTDPNYGGVWGDRGVGIVVAVLDCSKVDADQIAEIAGGSNYLHLIEVPYTYREVDEFRDSLEGDLADSGLKYLVSIDSTLRGREIVVEVVDAAQLPARFGDGVPSNAYRIKENPFAGTEPAELD